MLTLLASIFGVELLSINKSAVDESVQLDISDEYYFLSENKSYKYHHHLMDFTTHSFYLIQNVILVPDIFFRFIIFRIWNMLC